MSEEPRIVAIIGGMPVEVIGPVFHASMREGGKNDIILSSIPREISCTVVIGEESQAVLRDLSKQVIANARGRPCQLDETWKKKPEQHPFKVNANQKTKGNHVYPFYQKGWK